MRFEEALKAMREGKKAKRPTQHNPRAIRCNMIVEVFKWNPREKEVKDWYEPLKTLGKMLGNINKRKNKMTKSQNTKKDLCITSEQLTEQWKKGELKLGEHYYYTTIFSPTVHIQNFTRDVVSFQDFKETVAEVLEPVPSYNKWKEKLRALDAAHKTIKMEDETINRLVRSGKQCNYENAQLKELLKECRDIMDKAGFMFAKVEDVKKAKDLIKKIEEVLK